jgi:uncharacterized protein YbbK (DUF523 family)
MSVQKNSKIIIVSACLAGLKTRYDGKIKQYPECLRKLENATWIPVCPEQLGGLATPRIAADIMNGDGYDVLEGRVRVITRTGIDVTEQFISGARQILKLAKINKGGIFLKSNSPSCGVSGKIGVTAALLSRHGYQLEEF